MTTVIAGDPGGTKPASYSRFVLPFAYHPEVTWEILDTGPAYKRCLRADDSGVWTEALVRRWRYLTAETAHALFQRTWWFRLEDPEGENGSYRFLIPRRRGGEVTVAATAPLLVLFEFVTAVERARRYSDDEGVEDLLATGFLIVDLFFPELGKPPDLEDLLALNEVFRYWREPYAGHADDESNGYQRILGELPLSPLSPGGPTIDGDPGGDLYTQRWSKLLECPLVLDEPIRVEHVEIHSLKLFPHRWEADAVGWLDHPVEKLRSSWAVYADTRAFVWTCALVDGGLESLFELFGRDHGAAGLGHWVKLLNVDFPRGDAGRCTAFERERTRASTYGRWEEGGTGYGFTYHSGAMLAPPVEDPPLWRHFGEMYFDQVLLLLYLRMTAFRFSRLLSAATAEARDPSRAAQDTWRRSFQLLRRDFVLFTNLYRFPLVSNQQQGLEMFETARAALDVEELFAEVQEEVRSTHDYFETETAKELADADKRFTVAAFIGLPLALATGFLGMNVLSSKTGAELLSFASPWWSLAGFVAATGGFFGVMFWAMRKTDRVFGWLTGKVEKPRRDRE